MKKCSSLLFLFVTCFLLIINTQAQETNSMELPTIIPPSPTAFQLTRYGDVSINESTGNISPSIPLYTYQAGRLQLPISLSFQGNGVKVDQAASWTGINWNLNAGGVITRTVKDEDDIFFEGERSSYPYQDLYNYDTVTTESAMEMNSFISSSTIDSEADIFSFSFASYSGSFYFDKDMHPRLTKNDTPLKIELDSVPPFENGLIQHEKREIVITTPDGVKYFFGGLEASESSRSFRQSAGSEFYQDDYAQTSFYLHKIEHPLGDHIILVYTSYDYDIDIAKSESLTKVVSKILDCSESDSSSQLESLKNESIRLQSTNGKILSRIYSNKNDYEIVFSASTSNSNVSNHYAKKLNSITIRKPNDQGGFDNLKAVGLSYFFPHNENLFDMNNAQRFFLKSVSFSDGNSNSEYKYDMEYNNPQDLPNRFSFSQDYFGYYNGIENTRYLPQNYHPIFATIYSTLADKSFDFEFASKGVLKTIHYPTKGYTDFEYETELVPAEEAYNVKNKRSNLYINYNNEPPGGIVSNNPYTTSIGLPTLIDLNINGEGTSQVLSDELIDQEITINLINIYSSELLDNNSKFCLTIYDVTDDNYLIPQCYEFVSFQFINDPPTIYDPYLDQVVYVYPDLSLNDIPLSEGHQYDITVEIDPASFNSTATIYSVVDFDYKIKSNGFEQTGDIRIKRITDNNLNQITNIKRFFYSTEGRVFLPRFLSGSFVRSCCISGPIGQPLYNDYNLIKLSSNSLTNLFAVGSNSKMYKTVSISYGGDNYENGGVEKEFIRVFDALPIPFFESGTEESSYTTSNSRENKSTCNGTLLKETIFKKDNEELKPVKETINDYSINRNTFFSNNICRVLYDECYNAHISLDHLSLELYHIYSNKIQLDSTTTKTFNYSNELQEPEYIKTKTSYQYNQHVGMPTTITTSTSVNSTSKKIEYIYPSTISDIVTHISQPIVIKNYRIDTDNSEELLSTVTKTHSNVFNSYNQTAKLLKEVLSLKVDFGEPDLLGEPRLIYHDYDNSGNPLEVSKADGTHIVYIWGYNKTLPIAKIENSTYSQVQSYVSNLQNLSNNEDDYEVDVINPDGSVTPVGNEGLLRQALNNLRDKPELSNAMITTYTYDPLIGVTSIADPKGYTVYYEYDDFNRLEHVKDRDGNILSRNEYHYKDQ